MEFKNKTILPLIIFSLLIVMAFLFFIIWWFTRHKGILITIQYFVIVLGIFIVIGTIVGILIYLFKRQRFDMVYINKQRILQACNICKPKHNQTLMLKGSTELESRFVGNVVGIARIKSEPLKEYIFKEKTDEPTKQEIDKTEKTLTFIAFKRSKGLLSWIESAKLFCGIEGDFSHLSGDIIYLNDMTFAPPLYDIFFLQKHYKETEKIDEPIAKAIYRYQLQENLKELKNITDDYLAISPQHQKQLERTRLGEIRRGVQDEPQQKAP